MSLLKRLLTEANLSADIIQQILSISNIEHDFAEHADGLNLDVHVYNDQLDDYVYSHQRNPDLIDLLVLYWAQANQNRTEYATLVNCCMQVQGRQAIQERAWEYV